MKSKYLFLTLAITAASMQGCNKDFLERPPLSAIADANYYSTKEEVMAATAPLYNIVWFDYNDKAALAFGDARGGLMKSNDRGIFYRFAVSSSDVSTLLPGYKSFYKIVAQSNLIIEGISRYAINVPEADKKAAISEAKFMRALAYYYLVMNWGDLPIIYDNKAQMLDKNQRRNTKESIWKFIIRDLRYAAANLPPLPAKEGRITKYSAEGMLAKMYLTRAGLNTSNGPTATRNQSDLDSAKYFANDVIKNGPYSLLPKYGDLFLSANNNSSKNNSESLFALQWMPMREPWGVNNSFQAYMAYDPIVTGTGDGWGRAQGASANMVRYYIDNPQDSIRRKQTFMFHQDPYPELNRKNGGIKSPNTDIAQIKKYIIGTPDDNGGKGVIMGAFINTYMLRLAEVYLIHAEAILGNSASTSNADALTSFNAVRTRAGMPTKSSITFMDIFMEKRVETAMEGTAWYDIVRWSYFDLNNALNFVGGLNHGNYTLTYNTGSNPRTWTFVEKTTAMPELKYQPTPVNMYLPIPETEMSFAPSLALDPVPFDFSVLKD